MFGVASLLLAALYLLDQRDYKRMLAYSSVEHMGILAIGVSFGAPIALAGVLLHVLAHAAAKGNAFMGAGVLVSKFGSKRIAAVSGGLDLLPWSGPLFLLAVLALSAMPPFGIFRSEFEIVAGGLATSADATAAVLIIGVTVAFFGLSAAATWMLFRPRAPAPASGERTLVRVPPWRSATAGVSGASGYTAFGFANPTRRVLAAVLRTRAEVRPIGPHAGDAGGSGADADGSGPHAGDADRSAAAPPAGLPHIGYASDVIEVVERYVYRPARRPLLALARAARRLQSGRLDAYLAYMLVALASAVTPAGGFIRDPGAPRATSAH